MFKLLFFAILLVNLDLVYGPLFTINPGKLPILNKINLKSAPRLTRLFGDKKSSPSETISVNSPLSQVMMPKKELTQDLSISLSYRALPIEISKEGECFLPEEIDDYLKSTETVSPKDSFRIEFFCPTNNPDENSCMLPTNYRQCATEPRPVIKRIVKPCDYGDKASQQPENSADASQNVDEEHKQCPALCGPVGEGEMYIFVYQNNKLIVEDYEIYSFCYNHKKRETIYTHHEMKLSKKLKREQMNFEMSNKDYGYFEGVFKIAENVYKNSENVYQAQKLVPPEDFSLALRKIPTFHYVNVRPQHQDLIKLWNVIGELIRNGSFARNNYKHFIYTGTFRLTIDVRDIEYMGDKEIEIPEFWIKVVLLKDIKDSKKITRGLAILMYNNIEQTSTINWDKYCEYDYCLISHRKDDIFKNLTNAGLKVRCCLLNENILKLFNLEREYEIENIHSLLVENLIDSRFIIKEPESQDETK